MSRAKQRARRLMPAAVFKYNAPRKLHTLALPAPWHAIHLSSSYISPLLPSPTSCLFSLFRPTSPASFRPWLRTRSHPFCSTRRPLLLRLAIQQQVPSCTLLSILLHSAHALFSLLFHPRERFFLPLHPSHLPPHTPAMHAVIS
jgi:hypothetical protein